MKTDMRLCGHLAKYLSEKKMFRAEIVMKQISCMLYFLRKSYRFEVSKDGRCYESICELNIQGPTVTTWTL